MWGEPQSAGTIEAAFIYHRPFGCVCAATRHRGCIVYIYCFASTVVSCHLQLSDLTRTACVSQPPS